MDSEIVAPVQDERVAVGAVELCHGLAALDVPRVARSGDDVVEDDVFARSVAQPPWGLRLPGTIQLAVHAVFRSRRRPPPRRHRPALPRARPLRSRPPDGAPPPP